MSDDIVTRLRNENNQFDFYEWNQAESLMLEAANEIERLLNIIQNDTYVTQLQADEIEYLRAEVKALKYLISPAPTPNYTYFVHPDAVSTYEQVLKGIDGKQ